ncbi:MAG: hypothetical protein QXU65_06510, partial [Sulfolobales archaeon]
GGGMELDVVAVGSIDIFSQTRAKSPLVYVVEGKLAYTRKLIRDVVEEAILRLTVADYVLIAAPRKARIWISNKELAEVVVVDEIRKRLYGTYSRKLGLMAIDVASVEVTKNPERSRLYVPSAKELIIKSVLKKF